MLAYVLEQALRYDKVELHPLETDRVLQDVDLNKVRCWLWDGYVDAVILHVRRHEAAEGAGAATDIKEAALLAAGVPADHAGDLPHPEVRRGIFKVFLGPEIFLVVLNASRDRVLSCLGPRRVVAHKSSWCRC